MLRILRVVTVTLVALVLGMSFAHVLEWPAKLAYEAALYIRLQTSLYAQFGPPGAGGFVEPSAILATLALAVAVRRRRALPFVAGAAVALLLAFPVVFFWLVAPANDAFRAAASTGVIPTDWAAWRDRWEWGHALRFGLHLVAFILLMAAPTTGEEPARTSRPAA